MMLRDVINKMIKDNSHSHASLAKAMGYKSSASISNVTSRNDMKVSFLLEMCDSLGYEIVLRPTRGENKSERTMVVTKECE